MLIHEPDRMTEKGGGLWFWPQTVCSSYEVKR